MEMEERPLLRVEDALMYLDQVKVEFGDRPQIYNEFLDIMKTFKTQQIDTPGVIRRVSNLFQGNRRLVLGFNTFLPDGYRIEVPPDGIGPPVAVYRAPGSDAVHILRESPESEAVSVSQVAAAAAAAQQQGLPPPNVNRLPPQGHPPPVPPIQPSRGNPILPADPGGVAPRARNGDAPRPLANAGQPPRPQQALPGGVAPRQPSGGNRPPIQAHPTKPPGSAGVPPPPPPPVPQNGQPRQASGGQQPSPNKAPAEGNGNGHLEFDHAINYVTTIKRRFSADPGTYKKFLEILHTYQKEQRGIKEILEEVSELFEDHPDLLREFTFFLPDAVQNQAKVQLDQLAKEAEERKRSRAQAAIMNTAQNMRQIPPVRNSNTGSVEPEITLVNGRTQPTQYKLTERELSICREAQYGIVRFESARPPRKYMPTVPVAAQKYGRPRSLPIEPIVLSVVETIFFEDVKAHLSRKELMVEKPTTGNKIHTPYVEFLKHLHMFGAGFLSKEDLLKLSKPFFYHGHSGRSGAIKETGELSVENSSLKANADRLLKLLERIMIDRGPYGRQQKAATLKTFYGQANRRMMNFEACSNPTPSYRPYPPDFPHSVLGKCEGKSIVDAEVLNDQLLCISPEVARAGEMESRQSVKKRKADSIEESNASKRRHNAYEENLFRVEDERFELDMAIERNLHVLRKLEPLVEEVQKLSSKEEKDGQPIGRLRYQLKSNTLNSLHIGAIARIYGDRSEEIIQYLAKNPLVALPVIHKRLKTKKEEWKRVKEKLTKDWKKECELNYEGSFNVKCYFYRRALEKFSSVHRLVDQCKKVRTFISHPEKLKSSKATEPFLPSFHKWNPDSGSLFFQPYLECECTPDESHKFAFELVSHCIKSSEAVSPFDRECIGRIWSEFVLPWFQYPTNWMASEIRESFTGKLGAGVAQFACGQTVMTVFGEGTVAAFNNATEHLGPSYRVRLPCGLAFLSPSAILYAKPSLENRYVRNDGLMVRDTSSMEVDNDGARLDEKHQVLFATETTYVFVRLYSLLCSVLKKALDCYRTLGPQPDPRSSYVTPSEEPPVVQKLNFSAIINMTKEVVSRTAEVADLESLGRKICKNDVHLVACLPKLVDRCADALLKVSEEDTLLQLYDFCQYRSPDVAALRARCLTAVPDATFRLQYVAADSCLFFGHQEIGHFPTQPPPDDDFLDEDTNMDTGDDMDEDVEFDAQGEATPEDANVNEEEATGATGGSQS